MCCISYRLLFEKKNSSNYNNNSTFKFSLFKSNGKKERNKRAHTFIHTSKILESYVHIQYNMYSVYMCN